MKPLAHVAAGFGLALLVAASGAAAWLAPSTRLVASVALPLGAMALLAAGLVRRMWVWARTPVPYRIPTTAGQQRSLPWLKPGRLESPSTPAGVVGRMALEGLLFRSLFRNTRAEVRPDFRLVHRENKYLWLGALAFHASLAVVLLRHLRFAFEPVPSPVSLAAAIDGFFQLGTPAVLVSDVALVAGLLYLTGRRLTDPLVRYVSLASDFFPLGLLAGIAATGLLMRHLWGADVVAVKAYVMSVAGLAPPAPAPTGMLLGAHVAMVSVLVAMVPYGKLSHMVGVWLSPTRNLANTSRARRHVNPWQPHGATRAYAEWEAEFRDRIRTAGLPLDEDSR